VTVDGLAASAASIISMVGDTVEMSPASQLMIHDAWTVAIGNADDMRAEADVIDSISQIGAELYADKAGGTAEAWRGKMRAESWYAPSEAVDGRARRRRAARPPRQRRGPVRTGPASNARPAASSGTPAARRRRRR
jgi:hypothetical protein